MNLQELFDKIEVFDNNTIVDGKPLKLIMFLDPNEEGIKKIGLCMDYEEGAEEIVVCDVNKEGLEFKVITN